MHDCNCTINCTINVPFVHYTLLEVCTIQQIIITINSRIVSIHIQLKGCTFCGVNRHNRNICLTEISVNVE